MGLRDKITLFDFGAEQRDVLFMYYALQRSFPGKSKLEYPDISIYRPKELSESEIEELTDILEGLMPTNTIVTDMSNWDEHVQRTVFEDRIVDIALGPEEYALSHVKPLQDEVLRCIDEYGMDYNQNGFEEESFEDFVHEQCREFIKGWRRNMEKCAIEKPGGTRISQ